MAYSIVQLFELIDQPKSKNEFYHEYAGGFGVNYYMNRITGFRPKDTKMLWGYCGENTLVGLDVHKETICICDDEVILFLYDSHNEDFEVHRIKNMDEVLKFLYSKNGLQHEFWGDICIICNGKRQKYFVRDSVGQIVTHDDMVHMDKANMNYSCHIEFE